MVFRLQVFMFRDPNMPAVLCGGAETEGPTVTGGVTRDGAA
jgi:hypothetical protein